jgi:SAM-dependent methyltransferase
MVEPGEFRDRLETAWDGAAVGWDRWSGMLERSAVRVSERLVELAGVEAGSRVLDVGSGYGEPALTAARAAAPDGIVVATDISAEMLAYARARAEQAGVENMEFEHIAAGTLDFPHESFDAAVSRWGIIFDPEGEAAVERVRSFLKPESRFAISSWAMPDEVPFLGVPIKTVIEETGASPPPPGTPGPLSRPTETAIASLLEDGGFSDVRAERIDVAMDFDSGEDAATYVREIAPPVSALMADEPEEAQRAVWEKIAERFGERAADDGRVSLSSVALLASGSA